MTTPLVCLTLPVVAKHINAKYSMLTIDEPGLAVRCKPGNFFELRAALAGPRKLYKPISIYRVDGSQISFLIKRLGAGSEALCALQSGDLMELYGPLGNEFPIVTEQHVLLVSGGVGYPPLVYLKTALEAANTVYSLHGATTAEDRFPADEIWQMQPPAEHLGYVTEGLSRYLDQNQVDVVYSCGPEAMLKAVAEICAARAVKLYVSMEAYMACGIGACHGCTIPVGDPEHWDYLRVCKEGPVFDAATIRWELL